jgi:hypothetical protein
MSGEEALVTQILAVPFYVEDVSLAGGDGSYAEFEYIERFSYDAKSVGYEVYAADLILRRTIGDDVSTFLICSDTNDALTDAILMNPIPSRIWF